MIRTLSYKNVSIICPQNRVENYLAYCAHVFKISKVKFIKEIKFLEQNTDKVFRTKYRYCIYRSEKFCFR
jgi:hypothetical protein